MADGLLSPSRLLLLPLALSMMVAMGCATVQKVLRESFKEPEVELRNVDVRDLSYDDVTLDFEFLVTNPNDVAVKLQGLDYALDVNGKSLVKGETQEALRLAANGSAPVRLPLTVTFRDLVANLATLFSSRSSVPYALDAGFGLDTPIGVVRVPVEASGEVPLPKPPDVQLADVKLASLGLTGARIEVQLDVRNRSTFPIQPKGLLYDLAIAGTSVSKGNESLPAVGANEERRVAIPIQLDFMKLGTAAVQAVRSRTLPYSVKGSVDLGVFRQPFDLTGTAKL